MNQDDNDLREPDGGYLSYLVRLLRTQSGDLPVWRVSLEEPLTQKILRFHDLHGLYSFLLAQTGQGSEIITGNREASTDGGLPGRSFEAHGTSTETGFGNS